MGYDCIRISRERGGFTVSVTDPEIQKKNQARDSKSDGPSEPWQDPCVDYSFDTKEQVVDFITNAIDIALPPETFSSAFDRIAKEATKST